MKAAVFLGEGVLSIEDRPEPEIVRPDDALIEVETCGICGTDLHILDVPPGHPATAGVILGHEFVGRVSTVGPEASIDLGRRVAIVTDLNCGECRWCRRGLLNHCENLRSLGVFEDGGLAPLARVPSRACQPIREDLPAEIAALTEPIACVMNALERSHLLPGGSVAVFGAGPIGTIFTALLRSSGAGTVVVVEPVAARRAAAYALGATAVVDPAAEDAVAAVRALTSDEGADVVVDAVGSQLTAALASARPQGRVVLFGMNASSAAAIRQYEITRKELSVIGAFVGTHAFPKAIGVLEAELVDWRPLVSHVLPLTDVAEGIDLLRSGDALKVVIDVGGGVAERGDQS